jgi:RNA polymerase sigma-70 factor (ECF subfamily)
MPAPDSPDVFDSFRQFQAGDLGARDRLLERNYERFRRLARRMLRGFPHLRRFEQTDDVLNAAMVDLHKTLATITPESPQHYFRLATLCIRRKLLDLTRHYFGPLGAGANQDTGGRPPDDPGGPLHAPSGESEGPRSLAEWGEFHAAVDGLPPDIREVVDLLWYQGLTQDAAAVVLGVDVRTVKRRWRAARLALGRFLGGSGEGEE